ncbi:Histone-lysine N-methyltransferase, H3 lysine-9 specific dim-5 [Fusarium oxysporum f. sp. albedinis]|nr:Histone-lysine N-methyltransferase, H3 lysine-9 specific dim-5 [Fusarium oxysporum f. sp. albedinis]
MPHQPLRQLPEVNGFILFPTSSVLYCHIFVSGHQQLFIMFQIIHPFHHKVKGYEKGPRLSRHSCHVSVPNMDCSLINNFQGLHEPA